MVDEQMRTPGELPPNAVEYGRYLLLEKLGEGGMASVYLAEMRGTGGFSKRLALKLMKANEQQPADFNKQFISEARLGGFLSHPNIVEIQDFGELETRLYLAMELVDGPSLDRVVALHRHAMQPIPLDIILQILIDVCHGLDHAHKATDHQGRPLKIIHRDLKPSNLLISRYGQAKIADFGVARASSNLVQTAVSGLAKGTARYMSPEQAWGLADIDYRSDLFSVGLILFELVTLTPMYSGMTKRELLRRAQDALVLPRLKDVPDLPWRGQLMPVLTRILSRDPAGRYQSGADLAKALTDILQQIPARRSLRDWCSDTYEALPMAPGTSRTFTFKEEPLRLEREDIVALMPGRSRPLEPPPPPPVHTDALDLRLSALHSSEWVMVGAKLEEVFKTGAPEGDTEALLANLPSTLEDIEPLVDIAQAPRAADVSSPRPGPDAVPQRKKLPSEKTPRKGAPSTGAGRVHAGGRASDIDPDQISTEEQVQVRPTRGGDTVDNRGRLRPREVIDPRSDIAENTTMPMTADRSDEEKIPNLATVPPPPVVHERKASALLLSLALVLLVAVWWLTRPEIHSAPSREVVSNRHSTPAVKVNPVQGLVTPTPAPPTPTAPPEVVPTPDPASVARPTSASGHKRPSTTPTPGAVPVVPRADKIPRIAGFKLLINSRPAATILLDERSVGNTRDGHLTLPVMPGHHRITWVDPTTQSTLKAEVDAAAEGRMTCVAYFETNLVECQ